MSDELRNVIIILATLVVAGIAFWRLYRMQTPITLTSAVGTLEASVPLAQELVHVATIAVQSAEQLKREGKISTNDAAFNYALDYVKEWFPAAEEVSNERIIAAINSAVLVASYLTHQIEANKTVENGGP